jgi:hypothetical protein
VCIAFGLFWTVFAGIFLAATLEASIKAYDTRDWPTTSGTVMSREVEEVISGSADTGFSSSYYPRVKYTFEVAGEQYEGTRTGVYERGYNTPREVEDALGDKYRVGTGLTVRYNPTDPGDSVLTTENTGIHVVASVCLVWLVGPVLLVVGVCRLIANIRRRRGVLSNPGVTE